jgi:hypothetical protein
MEFDKNPKPLPAFTFVSSNFPIAYAFAFDVIDRFFE